MIALAAPAVAVGAAALGVTAWLAAPFMSMARHGTIDQRTVAAWRTEYTVPRQRAAGAQPAQISNIRTDAPPGALR